MWLLCNNNCKTQIRNICVVKTTQLCTPVENTTSVQMKILYLTLLLFSLSSTFVRILLISLKSRDWNIFSSGIIRQTFYSSLLWKLVSRQQKLHYDSTVSNVSKIGKVLKSWFQTLWKCRCKYSEFKYLLKYKNFFSISSNLIPMGVGHLVVNMETMSVLETCIRHA